MYATHTQQRLDSKQTLLYTFQVIQILWSDENLNWYHLCLFILSTNGVSQNAISPGAQSAWHKRNAHKPSGMQLFSSLDLFVVAVTLMRSVHGLHSFDRSARTGSVQGVICGKQTEFMIHYTSVFLSVTRVGENETLTSFIGLLWSCPSPAD